MYVLFSLLPNPLGWEVGCGELRSRVNHSRCGERSFWICALPVEVRGGSPRRGQSAGSSREAEPGAGPSPLTWLLNDCPLSPMRCLKPALGLELEEKHAFVPRSGTNRAHLTRWTQTASDSHESCESLHSPPSQQTPGSAASCVSLRQVSAPRSASRFSI